MKYIIKTDNEASLPNVSYRMLIYNESTSTSHFKEPNRLIFFTIDEFFPMN